MALAQTDALYVRSHYGGSFPIASEKPTGSGNMLLDMISMITWASEPGRQQRARLRSQLRLSAQRARRRRGDARPVLRRSKDNALDALLTASRRGRRGGGQRVPRFVGYSRNTPATNPHGASRNPESRRKH